MKGRTLVRFLMIGLLALLVANLATAMADANTVPPVNLGDQSQAVTANDLKPSECAGLNLTEIITGSGTITGTPGNDLIVGSPGADIIQGLGGNDCIVGRGGADTLDGGSGGDVCIGEGGIATFTDCEVTYP